MTAHQIRALTVLIVFTVVGVLLAAAVAPEPNGHDRSVVLGVGLSLFAAGLTNFLIRFTEGVA